MVMGKSEIGSSVVGSFATRTANRVSVDRGHDLVSGNAPPTIVILLYNAMLASCG